MQTLNQVIKIFEDFASAHLQINSFGQGDVWETATSGTTNYPLMWVDVQPSVIKTNVTEYRLRVYLMDLPSKDERDETEILSDMILIAQDVVDELKHPDYDFRFIQDEIQAEGFTEWGDDQATGVFFDVEIGLKRPADRCAIPYTAINRNQETNVVTIRNATTGATVTTVSPGETYDVLVFSGINGGTASSTYSNSIVSI